MQRDNERGFTLVELLVVSAVVGVLVGLLLPAVQSGRASARKASCINNMKALGLGLHNYESANGILPMSMVLGKGHGNGHSAFAAILPYLEQAALYNMYNFDLENWHIANQTAASSPVRLYLCPDNPDVDRVPAADVRFPESKGVFAKGHYGVNWGGGQGNWKGGGGDYRRTPPTGGARGPWGDDFAKDRGTYLGVMMTVIAPDGQVKGADGKPRARNVSFRDIIDGTSFTVAFAEKRDSFGWAVGGWGGSEFDVYTSPAYEGDERLARKVYSGSTHAGGPNVALCDGSVRTLSPKLDKGLWYAIITRAGGEVVRFNK